uniref:Metaxin-2 n=1 Tax=Schistocephalus solidus TaxID=70667 RepID=A0A0X3P3M4_SCHSO
MVHLEPVQLVMSPRAFSLPNDIATTEACRTYLKLKGISVSCRELPNAYAVSPDGLLPVLNIHGRLVSGFMSMCLAIKATKKNPNLELKSEILQAKNSHHVFFFWLSDALRNIAIYFSWVNPSGLQRTKYILQKAFPWPVCNIIFNRQKLAYEKYMEAIGWLSRETGEIVEEFDRVCSKVSKVLTNDHFVFERKKPGKIDCILCSYFVTFEKYPIFFSPLLGVMSNYPALRQLVTLLERSMLSKI